MPREEDLSKLLLDFEFDYHGFMRKKPQYGAEIDGIICNSIRTT